jgi:cell division protein FtsB
VYARRVARRTAARQAAGAQGRWSTRRTVVLLLVAGALLLTLVMPLRTYFAQLSEVKELEAERAQLLAEVAELESKKEQQSDPGYIRAQARSRLGFVFPGERAYNVYFADDPPPPSIESVEESSSEGPWYVDLWREISVKTIIEEAPPMHLPIAPIEQDSADPQGGTP